MEINVTEIRKSKGEVFSFQLAAEFTPLELGNEKYIFQGPVHFNFTIVNTGRFLEAKGQVIGTLELNCVRCLEKFSFTLEAPFEEEYCHESDVNRIDEEDGMNEDCHVFIGDKINFTNDVKETIILNLPMKPVCRDNCRGICPVCGQNLNISECNCKKEETDPRLEILKKLLDT